MRLTVSVDSCSSETHNKRKLLSHQQTQAATPAHGGEKFSAEEQQRWVSVQTEAFPTHLLSFSCCIPVNENDYYIPILFLDIYHGCSLVFSWCWFIFGSHLLIYMASSTANQSLHTSKMVLNHYTAAHRVPHGDNESPVLPIFICSVHK